LKEKGGGGQVTEVTVFIVVDVLFVFLFVAARSVTAAAFF
jgi:hypothetical protein